MGTHPIVIGGKISGTFDVAHNVMLSDDAVARVKVLLEQKGRDDLRLRVAVQPGGCSGLMYQFYFDECELEDDTIRDFDGAEIIVDKTPKLYPDGATIGFTDSTDRQDFTIDNPNAAGSYVCGDSSH